jgi:exonuclease III
MAAHLNINSLRYKFDEIKEVLTDNIVDLLIISETKLDESFNDNLFSVDGFKDLSANLEKCSVNSLFDIEGGLYAPAINHFLSLIYIS